MKLELGVRLVDDLVPYHRNAKDHGDNDIEAICRSIQRFGFNDPIGITPEGIIIEGHGRLAAARKLGLTEVPVLVIEGMTEEQVDLYRIGHNKIALVSQFDFTKLYALITDIAGSTDIVAQDMGFTELGIAALNLQFGIRNEGPSVAADSTAIEYDVIWENKGEKDRMNAFLKELSEAAASDTISSGDLLLAKVRETNPTLYNQLVAAVPGVTDLDLEISALATETQNVRS